MDTDVKGCVCVCVRICMQKPDLYRANGTTAVASGPATVNYNLQLFHWLGFENFFNFPNSAHHLLWEHPKIGPLVLQWNSLKFKGGGESLDFSLRGYYACQKNLPDRVLEINWQDAIEANQLELKGQNLWTQVPMEKLHHLSWKHFFNFNKCSSKIHHI